MDPITASIALSITQLCISATMIGVYYAAPSERYTRLWACSGVLTALGMTIIFLNQARAPGLMLILGNVMLIAGCAVVWVGLRAFYEQPISRWSYLPIALFTAAYTLLIAIGAEFAARAILSSASLIVIFILCVHAVWSGPNTPALRNRGYARGMALTGLIILMSGHAARIVMLCYRPELSAAGHQSQVNAAVVYLVPLAGTVLFFPAVLLLYFERIRHQLLWSLEAKQEALDIQTRFVEMFSHEYRTPLAVIRTNLAILQSKDEAGGRRLAANLDKMQRAVLRLVEVAETALKSDQMADGQAGIHAQLVDLADFLPAVAAEAADYWGDRTARLACEAGTRATVRADVKLLKTALLNVIDNAIKYGPEQGTVDIALAVKDGTVAITVADRGPGIPEHELGLVHRKYFRGSRTASVAGSGVGLYLVWRIIGQHAGSVTLGNRSGGGAVATMILPLAVKENHDDGVGH
jgi:signal transduction histidine kinase